MTVQQILDYASSQLVGKSISPTDAIAWINDALDEMSTDARRFATSQLAVSAKDTWYDLPQACLKLDGEVLDSQGKPYYFWYTDGTRIKFRDVDTYTLRYYIAPTKVSTVNDVPECPEAFHQALAYYLAYRFDARDFPGSELAVARLNEYRLRYSEAKSRLQPKERYIRAWRWS